MAAVLGTPRVGAGGSSGTAAERGDKRERLRIIGLSCHVDFGTEWSKVGTGILAQGCPRHTMV